ncbi:hypothetical protein IAT40_006001 [Kwoniella sp. CBS 6097]
MLFLTHTTNRKATRGKTGLTIMSSNHSKGSNRMVLWKEERTGPMLATMNLMKLQMCNIVEMEPRSTLEDLLGMLAGAQEYSDLRMRPGESKHPEIRYQLDDQVKSYADKVFLLLQYTFGNVIINEEKNPETTSIKQTLYQIFSRASRIAKAIVQVAASNQYGPALRAALALYRTVSGMAWEDTSVIFRQIENIGPKTIKNLGGLGIKSELTFTQLQPFFKSYNIVQDRKKDVRGLPQYVTTIEEENLDTSNPKKPVLVLRVTILPKGKKEDIKSEATRKKKGAWRPRYNISALFLRQKDGYIAFRRMSVKDWQKKKDASFLVRVDLDRRCDTFTAIVAVDEIAGSASVIEYPTNLADSVYPPDVKDDTPTPPPESQEVPTDIDEDRLPNGNLPCHHTCSGSGECAHKCCKDGVAPKPQARTMTKQAIATARLPITTKVTSVPVAHMESTVEESNTMSQGKEVEQESTSIPVEETDEIDCTKSAPTKRPKRRSADSPIKKTIEQDKATAKKSRQIDTSTTRAISRGASSSGSGGKSRTPDAVKAPDQAEQDDYEMIPPENSDEDRVLAAHHADPSSYLEDSAADTHLEMEDFVLPDYGDVSVNSASQAEPEKMQTDVVRDDWDEGDLFKNARIVPSSSLPPLISLPPPSSLPSMTHSQSNSQLTILGTPNTQYSQSNIALRGINSWAQAGDVNASTEPQNRAAKRARFSSASPEVNMYIPEDPYFPPDPPHREFGHPGPSQPFGTTHRKMAYDQADQQPRYRRQSLYERPRGWTSSPQQTQASSSTARPFLSADSLANRTSGRNNTQDLDAEDQDLLDLFDKPGVRFKD